jgi:hypothetical protein
LAAYCISNRDTGNGGIRYDEFVAICVDQIQKLKKQVELLTDEVNTLKTQQNDCSKEHETKDGAE